MRKLRDYAKEYGCCYRTAYNHFHLGLIEGAYQLSNGTIVVPDSINLKELINKTQECIITYSRVSSSENKDNLESQSKRLQDFCTAKGWIISDNLKEIGSGLNDKRHKLSKVLKEGKVTKIVVEHKDRLTRFGFNYIQELCNKINCEIVIINQSEGEKEDIIQDFVSVITSFCAKIYGQRRSKRKTEQIIKELEKSKEEVLK